VGCLGGARLSCATSSSATSTGERQSLAAVDSQSLNVVDCLLLGLLVHPDLTVQQKAQVITLTDGCNCYATMLIMLDVDQQTRWKHYSAVAQVYTTCTCVYCTALSCKLGHNTAHLNANN
jgi:hypothetical protein